MTDIANNTLTFFTGREVHKGETVPEDSWFGLTVENLKTDEING